MSLRNSFVFTMLVCGAVAVANETKPERKVYQMEDSGSEVKIPTPLWNLIQEYIPDKSLTFAPLKIRLQEKTKGVLIDPDLEIDLPLGGGEIDLSKFVRSHVQGTFLVFFEYDEIRETKEEKIFFLSRAKKRRLENEIWGAGCNKFMDIREFVDSVVSKKGLEVNTTRNRHLSVLGGTFIFYAKNQITQVTFKDSTAAQFFCEKPQKPAVGSSKEVSE